MSDAGLLGDTRTLRALSRELRAEAPTLGDAEVRFLVDAYYQMQDDRKRSDMRARFLEKDGEPNAFMRLLTGESEALEKLAKSALDAYTNNHPMGSWMREIHGIGPVISAGLLAHIDIHKCPTVGHIWQFAGLAGSGQRPWQRGEKRPWNARLKMLCWKASDSFVKFHGDEKCFYGHLYAERKVLEVERNETGAFAELAAAKLKDKPTHKEVSYWKQGKLSPGHVDARARRYAVKLFLAHLHGEWYRRVVGAEPPLPYPIAHLGHAHVIQP